MLLGVSLSLARGPLPCMVVGSGGEAYGGPGAGGAGGVRQPAGPGRCFFCWALLLHACGAGRSDSAGSSENSVPFSALVFCCLISFSCLVSSVCVCNVHKRQHHNI